MLAFVGRCAFAHWAEGEKEKDKNRFKVTAGNPFP